MVLTTTQIKDLIENPANPYIQEWQKDHASLDIYVNGGDVSSELELVKNYENQAQKDLRDKIAKSTRDTVGYIVRPLSKVFTAAGASIELKKTSNKVSESFLKHIDQLPQGMSIKQWMQNYWLEAYKTDPNGVVLVETDNQGVAYPTYKSISVIHDYEMKWDSFEYIIMVYGEFFIGPVENGEKVKVYRVYDDEKDALYYISREDQELKEFESEDKVHLVKNVLGRVPAVVVSDIIDGKTNGRRSFLFPIQEVLKEYMRDSSVHSIYKFLHGYPIFWAYASKCSTCEGEGKIKNERYIEGGNEPLRKICPTCNGNRLKVTKDVSDGIRLPIPENGDDVSIAPDIAGYIQPDLDTWAQQEKTMKDMERGMHFSTWGTHVEEEKSNTATGRYIDAQPVNDKLRDVSDTVERKETKIIQFIGELQYLGFGTATSTYGKRFMIETPDILWEKYMEAKEKKVPISALDNLYKQYLRGEYYGDNIMLEQKMKEFYLEPFPHYSLADLSGSATANQLQRKILYSNWINQGIDFTKEFTVLEEEFNQYIIENEEITEVQSAVPGGEVN